MLSTTDRIATGLVGTRSVEQASRQVDGLSEVVAVAGDATPQCTNNIALRRPWI